MHISKLIKFQNFTTASKYSRSSTAEDFWTWARVPFTSYRPIVASRTRRLRLERPKCEPRKPDVALLPYLGQIWVSFCLGHHPGIDPRVRSESRSFSGRRNRVP
ncbi:hypothetical protein J6590_016631 [Homalodisca vitripennis]|nr:hypothetical protein J6590_016631 [Homalodisca vitripennis]